MTTIVRDNAYTQQVLNDALIKLTELRDNEKDAFVKAKLDYIFGVLQLFKLVTSSGNDIPAFRGLGWNECVDYAENVLNESWDPKTITVTRFNPLIEVVQHKR